MPHALNISDAMAFKHSTPEAENTFIVSWCFFNLCNYDCSYCPPNLKSGSLKGLPLATVQEIVDGLLELYPQKKFLFEFTGGEITLYRDFTPMVNYLREKDCDVNILSNGSRPAEWWKQHAPLIKHVCLSFHLERACSDHYIEILKIITATTTVHLNIMVIPARLQECLDFYESVKSLYPQISLALQPLAGHPGVTLTDYTAKELFILQSQHADKVDTPKSGPGYLFSKPHQSYRSDMQWHFSEGAKQNTTANEVIAASTNNWLGWKCSAGLEMLIIDWQGDIHRRLVQGRRKSRQRV